METALISFTLVFARRSTKYHMRNLCTSYTTMELQGIVPPYTTGHVFNWVKDFLTDRKQRVIINGSKSEWVNQEYPRAVSSDQLCSWCLSVTFRMQLLFVWTSFQTMEKYSAKSKHRRIGWLSKAMWIKLNTAGLYMGYVWQKKCHHMHVGKYTPVGNYTMTENEIPVEIEKVEYEKDLGIIVDQKLKIRDVQFAISTTMIIPVLFNVNPFTCMSFIWLKIIKFYLSVWQIMLMSWSVRIHTQLAFFIKL